jgi:putative transposase
LLSDQTDAPWRITQLSDYVSTISNEERGQLPKAVLLRCRVRYFTDGAILGSAEFVRGFAHDYQIGKGRKSPPRANALAGDVWDGLCVARGLRRQVFG